MTLSAVSLSTAECRMSCRLRRDRSAVTTCCSLRSHAARIPRMLLRPSKARMWKTFCEMNQNSTTTITHENWEHTHSELVSFDWRAYSTSSLRFFAVVSFAIPSKIEIRTLSMSSCGDIQMSRVSQHCAERRREKLMPCRKFTVKLNTKVTQKRDQRSALALRLVRFNR